MQTNDLKEYLNTTGTSLSDFAISLDCNKFYLDRVMKGKVVPGRRLAKDIFAVTYGAIALNTKPRKERVAKQQQVA